MRLVIAMHLGVQLDQRANRVFPNGHAINKEFIERENLPRFFHFFRAMAGFPLAAAG